MTEIKDIGKEIQTLRIQKGMSLNGLQKTSGVTRRMISNVEKGANVSTDILAKIFEGLGCILLVEVKPK